MYLRSKELFVLHFHILCIPIDDFFLKIAFIAGKAGCCCARFTSATTPRSASGSLSKAPAICRRSSSANPCSRAASARLSHPTTRPTRSATPDCPGHHKDGQKRLTCVEERLEFCSQSLSLTDQQSTSCLR